MIDGFEYKDISRLYDKLSRQFHGSDIVGELVTRLGEWLRGHEEDPVVGKAEMVAEMTEAGVLAREDTQVERMRRKIKNQREEIVRLLDERDEILDRVGASEMRNKNQAAQLRRRKEEAIKALNEGLNKGRLFVGHDPSHQTDADVYSMWHTMDPVEDVRQQLKVMTEDRDSMCKEEKRHRENSDRFHGYWQDAEERLIRMTEKAGIEDPSLEMDAADMWGRVRKAESEATFQGQLRLQEHADHLETTGNLRTQKVKLAARIQELQYLNQGLLTDRRQIELELKAMAEDRDEYRDKCKFTLRYVSLPDDTTYDEAQLVIAFADKLMGEGRREHGPLNLATDSRSVEDLLKEAVDEGLDSISYMLMARAKMGAKP